MQKNIPVILASDDNYASFVATTIYSILENTSSFIDFYILDGGITNKSKKLIEQSLDMFKNYSITYFDMSKFDLSRFPNVKHYSLNTFSRYFIPELVPDLKKVIYMDVDIIVKGDIKELYEENLDKYAVGAVLENFYEGNYKYLKEKIYPQYQGGEKYFNAGVLLLNVSQFRENNFSEKLIDLTIKLFNKLNCPDQDIFNIVFENNFKQLDYKYNYMPDYTELMKKKNIEVINPVILHYTGPKPWKAQSAGKEDFDRVLKQTKFYEIVRQKYKTLAENNNKVVKKFYLFNILPIYKIKKKGNKSKHYLFGFIPFLKIKEKKNV